MKNGLDEQYIDLLKDILENGVKKNTRNGEVLSVFSRTIRYKFKDGKFPLLTTKKMHWKSIVTELLWFLRGDTNIRYLVDNDCHIWDGDAYKNYCNLVPKYTGCCPDCGEGYQNEELWDNDDECICGNEKVPSRLSQKEFINKIKTDDEFAKQWGNLGKIYGFQWRNWNGKTKDELYQDYLKKIQTK
jgi:thymidylate synthase